MIVGGFCTVGVFFGDDLCAVEEDFDSTIREQIAFK